MRTQITPEDAAIIFKMWSRELKKNRKSQVHLGLAMTVPVGPLFRGNEFATLFVRLLSMHLMAYKRNV